MPVAAGGNVVRLPRKPSTENGAGLKLSNCSAVLAGLVTVAGTSDRLRKVGNGVSPPPKLVKRGSNADAELRRICTGSSRLRVPTQRNSVQLFRRSCCCPPGVQVMILGETRSGIKLEVAARA